VTIAIAGGHDQIFCFVKDPKTILEHMSISFNMESYMLLDIVVTQTCVSCFFQLSQPFIVLYRIFGITLSAMSERKLNRMDEPKAMQFGRYCPQFIYCFGIAALYCATVPLVVVVCSAYFFIAEKVFSHQCLFVYCQTHDGGGKLMESFNRFLFLILYFSTMLVIVYLTFKADTEVEFRGTVGVLLIILLCFIWHIQTRIYHYFIEPSASLPMARARLIDNGSEGLTQDQSASLKMNQADSTLAVSDSYMSQNDPQAKLNRFTLGKGNPSAFILTDENNNPLQNELNSDNETYFYAYRQPIMNRQLWETVPKKQQ